MIEDNNQQNSGIISTQKLKDYGREAYVPFFNVVTKYQDEFIPYLNALSKGLQGSVDTLRKEGATEEEQYVSRFFEEASVSIRSACEKFQAKDMDSINSFVSDLGTKKPGILFGASYIAGLFFGRLGRHVANQRKTEKNVPSTTIMTPPTLDQNIH